MLGFVVFAPRIWVLSTLRCCVALPFTVSLLVPPEPLHSSDVPRQKTEEDPNTIIGNGGVLQPSVEVGLGGGYGDMPALWPLSKLGFPAGPRREPHVRSVSAKSAWSPQRHCSMRQPSGALCGWRDGG